MGFTRPAACLGDGRNSLNGRRNPDRRRTRSGKQIPRTRAQRSDRSGGGANSPPFSFPCCRGAAHLFKSFTASASTFSIAAFASFSNAYLNSYFHPLIQSIVHDSPALTSLDIPARIVRTRQYDEHIACRISNDMRRQTVEYDDYRWIFERFLDHRQNKKACFDEFQSTLFPCRCS